MGTRLSVEETLMWVPPTSMTRIFIEEKDTGSVGIPSDEWNFMDYLLFMSIFGF